MTNRYIQKRFRAKPQLNILKKIFLISIKINYQFFEHIL